MNKEVKKMAFNYDLLLKRMKENGMRNCDVAKYLGISPKTFHLKLISKNYFKQNEIVKLIELFDIDSNEINSIFFALKDR